MHGEGLRAKSREERIKALEACRADFEVAQLGQLQAREEQLRKLLDAIPLHIRRGNKRILNPLLFNAAYARILKLIILYGREIANGPRRKSVNAGEAQMPNGERVIVEVRYVRPQVQADKSPAQDEP